MKFGDFELTLVRESKFRLDAGAMYGVVPKTMWSKVASADESNRIQLTCNLLVIKTPAGNVLVETGMGERWTKEERERFCVETLVESKKMVQQAGLQNEEIDAVIISHLHFDHAGGALLYENGEFKPTFPNAKYYVQKGEWEFAQSTNTRARASYRREDFIALAELGVLELVDGDHEVLPGVFVKVTGGHTKHHQVVYFESKGNKGVYFADILPTKSHVQPPWVMGYDHFPLESCDVKSHFLNLAARENWLVVFDHEPDTAWGQVKIDERKKFQFEPLVTAETHK